MFDKLVQSIKSGIQDAQELEAVRQLFVQALSDMTLDVNEMGKLYREITSHGFSAEQIHELGVYALRDVIQRAKSDGRVDDAEMQLIQQIVNLTSVPNETLGELLSVLFVQRRLYEVSQGRLTPITVTGLNLYANEKAYWAEPVTLYEHKIVRRETVGRSQGVSLRIMRGVSYRIGGSKGQSVPIYDDVAVAQGQLIFTNQRVVFKGDRRTMMVMLKDVIGADPYTNAIVIHTNTSKQPLNFHYVRPESAELVAQILMQLLA
jgi:hypothetical protein